MKAKAHKIHQAATTTAMKIGTNKAEGTSTIKMVAVLIMAIASLILFHKQINPIKLSTNIAKNVIDKDKYKVSFD